MCYCRVLVADLLGLISTPIMGCYDNGCEMRIPIRELHLDLIRRHKTETLGFKRCIFWMLLASKLLVTWEKSVTSFVSRFCLQCNWKLCFRFRWNGVRDFKQYIEVALDHVHLGLGDLQFMNKLVLKRCFSLTGIVCIFDICEGWMLITMRFRCCT